MKASVPFASFYLPTLQAFSCDENLFLKLCEESSYFFFSNSQPSSFTLVFLHLPPLTPPVWSLRYLLSATERSGDICVFGVYLLCVLEALGEPLVPRRELESNQNREKLYCTNKQSLRNHFKTLTIISQWLVV